MIKNLTGNKKRENRRKGFTLMELLVVVAIIAILCSIVFIAVASIAKNMRLKQCNDYAKTIFMAAQSNLTAMRNNGELGDFNAEGIDHITMDDAFRAKVNFPSVDGAAEYVYTSSGFTKSYGLVLPVNSVETHVRGEQVIIEYNPVTGNVYAVFYCENDTNLLNEYRAGNLRNNEEKRRDKEIGYYCGSILSSKGIDVSGSTTSMEYRNNQEGEVFLRITYPDGMAGSTFEGGLDVTLNMIGEISGSQRKMKIMSSVGKDAAKCKQTGDALEITYVLDSLASGKSFVNFAAQDETGKGISQFKNESAFAGDGKFLPGENLSISAEVTYTGNGVSAPLESASLPRVNPLFKSLGSSGGKYTLVVENGRNLQNLNALTPSVAVKVQVVLFDKDIDWQETVAYYNKEYGNGNTYKNAAADAPARTLPYFVPIHNAPMFGTVNVSNVDVSFSNIGKCTLINGNGKKVIGLNIDSVKYSKPSDGEYYVSADYTASGKTVTNKQVVHYSLTGLFTYVNAEVTNLQIANSKIKGLDFANSDGTCSTGSLAGMAGYKAFFNGCGVYMEQKTLEDYSATTGPKAYDAAGDQNWYGVSGEGCVGGLVGYSRSQHLANGYLTDGDKTELSFLRCFGAVPVSGNMRGSGSTSYGYVNGVGGLVGVTRISNFYGCYASGDILATGVYTANLATNWELINLNGKKSMGAGGLVGTSQGSMYSNCFTTGDVKSNQAVGTGSFLGVMTYNASFNASSVNYSQLSLMDNCYTTGKVNGATGSTLVGGIGSIDLTTKLQSTDIVYTDFYQMIAPYYYEIRKIADSQNRDPHTAITAPSSPDGYKNGTVTYYYISKDCYYLDQSRTDEQVETSRTTIGAAICYDVLMNTVNSFSPSNWIDDQWDKIMTWTTDDGTTFEMAYYKIKVFQKYEEFSALKNFYIQQLQAAFDAPWVEPDTWKEAGGITNSIASPTGSYTFAMISGMNYHGDWPTVPLTHGLAYFEYYSHDPNTIHVQFDRADMGDLLSNDELRKLGAHVIADGYAVVLKQKPTANLSVKVGSTTVTLKYADAIAWNDGTRTVYLLTLTRTNLHTNVPARFATEGYYVPVSFTLPWKINNSSRSCTVYFNSFTANSQVNPSMIDRNDFDSPTKPENPGLIEIRTARQLAGIMDYRYSKLFVTEDYNYIQTLDIDASTYLSAQPQITSSTKLYNATGDLNLLKTTLYTNANGIGINNTAGTTITDFMGTYTGVGTGADRPVIANFFGRKYMGLFLSIGSTGKVSNLTLQMDSALTKDVSAKTNGNAGMLADTNKGTIENVDVVVSGAISLTAKNNAGLLVGKSTGTIENCNVSATAVTLKVTAGDTAVGGAVGNLEGKAKECSVKITTSLTTTAMKAGGFAGLANATVEGVTAEIKSLTCATTTAKVGGLVGNMTGGKCSDVHVTVSGASGSSSLSVLGGVVGTAANVGFVDSSATIEGTFTAVSAGGLVSAANSIVVKDCTVTIKGTLSGSSNVAGMAVGQETTESNSYDASMVIVDGGEILAGTGAAAGFTVRAQGECARCVVQLNNGRISGASAAGFATGVTGTVENNCAVVGSGTISGNVKAAGFAVNVFSGSSVAASRVTPALSQTAEAYKATSNAVLTVSSNGNAAGFAVTVETGAKVKNSDALCRLVCTNSSGFVDTNNGTIDSCIANVNMNTGYAFARENPGTVTNCYSWYGDGNAASSGVSRPGAGTGHYYSCYFADADVLPANFGTTKCVTLFDSDGNYQGSVTLTALTTAYSKLAKGNDRWFEPGVKEAYSFGMTGSYPYPMLRNHYGDWAGTRASSSSASPKTTNDSATTPEDAPGVVDPT